MNEEQFTERVRSLAAEFEFPPTPPIAARVDSRLRQPESAPRLRVQMALAAAVLALLITLFSIPAVRAAVFDILNIGAVQIFVSDALPAPTLEAMTITDLGEEVTLEEAQAQFPRPLRQPAALSVPDEVYMQQMIDEFPSVTLVWRADPDAKRPQIVLTQIGGPNFGMKLADGDQVETTTVNGDFAVWVKNSHVLSLNAFTYTRNIEIQRNVLLWNIDEITYRLESDLDRNAAVALAESLKEVSR